MTRIIRMQDKFLHLVSVCIKENILLKKKADKHEASWREEGGFPQTTLRWVTIASAYSGKYQSYLNQMELWKVEVGNETLETHIKTHFFQYSITTAVSFAHVGNSSKEVLSFCSLFTPMYTEAKNSCATTVRRSIVVELHPTALQAFTGGIPAHLFQFYRTRARLSETGTQLPMHRAWQKEKTKRTPKHKNREPSTHC